MVDRHNKEAILRLLRDDLEALEDTVKGKQRAGDLTDLELAIKTMQDDIENIERSIKDQSQAHSTTSAVLSDQNMLMSLARQERIANEDHQLAVALNDGQRPPRLLSGNTEPQPMHDENIDPVSIILQDLLTRISVRDELGNAEGSSRVVSSYQSTTRRVRCVSCLESHDAVLSMDRCGHEYCLDCTRQMFLGSIRDEELYPPRCCGNGIPPAVAMRVLNYSELREFSHRALEWTAKDRVYCADPTCSTFIPVFAINNDHGTCPECHKQTHLPCRSLAHPAMDCPLDETLPLVLDIAEAEGWKRCPHCRTMVELLRGCNHMTCRCGREFCYACTATWKTCECDLWHEGRLLDEAQQIVEEEVPQNAGHAVRQQALDGAIQNLRQHEDDGCEHHRHSQWAWRNRGSLQCDVCFHYLPEYIFMCRNCRMRVCWDCRRNRLR
ncbi:unnamed protein product [Penicillium salamii]|uniref:RBR-type E3 ubiquitin transferase n=1 Tax=Penicillium salamii TaxID=1612424 RepID=A0A9W4NN84_9EURO|nr:unnamed protein product [Penicillium salamii]CAG8117412.1 unnamed protein product [Penicillium salamii]CAG8280273.1 unnamed protein product [Penicillium salamii]CAG8362571.1 unnamed protein product [Penicillium salamii]CAG8365363.1 unnamed protein product [Penicillium salamii]